MPVNAIPPTNIITDKEGKLTALWQAFFSSVHDWLSPIGSSGTTTNRPVDRTQNPLYISQQYFDTTLGKPIWVQSKNPTVWCDATGASV